jgi:3-methylcrotonyl-CoA carboxylase alpha subunit
MDEVTREAVCAAAVRAAKAVDYEGAGTIEFIADASEGLRAERIWFMEMNTRLQVEHPVTEEITGVDLVEWQLRVASGESLPLKQEELSINGWAMEARLYAEDPAKGFLPSVGRLEHFYLHDEARIETGVEEGDVISPYYDPMIAKIVTHGTDRDEARLAMMRTISKSYAAPIRTNSGFLFACLASPTFISGQMTTSFIGEAQDSLMPPTIPSLAATNQAAAALLAARAEFASIDSDNAPVGLQNFRLNSRAVDQVRMESRGAVLIGNAAQSAGSFPEIGPFYTPLTDELVVVTEFGEAFVFSAPPVIRGTGHHSAHDGDILSPMPGKIIAVEVTAGQPVTKGQKLLTLEAMKMEHTLVAPFDGVVAELSAVAGAQVQVEALLARIEPQGD